MEIYTYPSETAENRLKKIFERSVSFNPEAVESVQGILEDVKKYGDRALIQYAQRFDAPGLTLEELCVTADEMTEAESSVDEAFLRSLNRAADHIESFHRRQIRKSWITMDRPGTILGQLFNPVDSAGVYVPGGRAGTTPLVSSVLMGAIPAKVAGVKKIIMTTPPTPEGKVSPHMLAAARKAGVHTVYKAGSAWGIGAMAYGTKTIPRCDVIVGPGNIYVVIAKKIVAGETGIDMFAGPSEILVIADDSAHPEFTAADLLSQAEHDPLSASILITDSSETGRAVQAAVNRQAETLSRKGIVLESLANYGVILVVPDIPAALELANRIAPEHLELHLKNPFEYLGMIRNAGAVFLGNYTPEPVGDYIAGPNHVLPTARAARFSSALSVDNFIKKTSVIHYSEAAFNAEAQDIIRLAEIEGLDAHARSVKVRLEK
jgi:histidinol dehydrogenase